MYIVHNIMHKFHSKTQTLANNIDIQISLVNSTRPNNYIYSIILVEFKCGVKRSKAGQRLIGGDNTEVRILCIWTSVKLTICTVNSYIWGSLAIQPRDFTKNLGLRQIYNFDRKCLRSEAKQKGHLRKHTISTSLSPMFPSKLEWMDCIIPISLYTFALYSFYYSWVKVNSQPYSLCHPS